MSRRHLRHTGGADLWWWHTCVDEPWRVSATHVGDWCMICSSDGTRVVAPSIDCLQGSSLFREVPCQDRLTLAITGAFLLLLFTAVVYAQPPSWNTTVLTADGYVKGYAHNGVSGLARDGDGAGNLAARDAHNLKSRRFRDPIPTAALAAVVTEHR